jgi:SNF2 family DNA or RNA helicase
MNNTFDLYAQLHFLVPGLFGGQEFFRKEYAHPIDRERNEDKILALQKITAPFVLRRTKQQVATDLPPKTESVLWCEMGSEQKALYEETKAQIRDSLFLNIKQEGLNKSKLSILQGMQKLRQICAAPKLLKDPGMDGIPSVKAELLMEELQSNLKNNKVLVFSQFKGMLNLIAETCRKADLPYYHFDGDTPPEKRSELVAEFQAPGNKVNIFLISLKAGNTGLTLTAADYVFLVDPWWNTAVQQQAIDRAYRIGQTKNVFAYQMICKDSIEERIVELQQRKRSLSDALISEEDGFMKALSEEDLKFIFS